jgi:hypothetical protein
MYSNISNKDLELLTFINEHPCLSSQDISLFFDIKLFTLRTRLRVLCEYKFISFLTVSSFKGFKYYFSTKKGNKMIIKASNKFNKFDTSEKKLFLRHIIESNDFFIHLKKISLDNGYNFSDWVSDVNTAILFKYNGSSYKLIPDGYCMFKDINIYLELDRSTESFFKILRKIEVYSNFYLSMEYKKYFSEFPMVIFIFPDLKRAKFIQDKVEAYITLKKYKEELNFFYFFDKLDFYKNTESYL